MHVTYFYQVIDGSRVTSYQTIAGSRVTYYYQAIGGSRKYNLLSNYFRLLKGTVQRDGSGRK